MPSESVRVFVRCRPFNKLERGKKCERIVFIKKETNQISMKAPDKPAKTFTFDGVYNPGTQEEVYLETANGLVANVIDGFNGTIFAYGQTGCGKTYSMMGLESPSEQKGIIPRSFDQIFETIDGNEDKSKKYLVRGAFIEIYNEEVRDLLAKDYKTPLQVKEHPEKAGSSRSHSIFILHVETVTHDEASGDDRFTAGKLNLVDLAGSERQSKTGAEGVRLKEATKINLSLSALGNVISALVAGKSKHIPYRDSKLTRLLQDSLGGNTKTVMIAAASPADYNYDETLSTLRYANRAKNIKNKPVKNEDPKDALLREYQEEIKRLKQMLQMQQTGAPMPTDGPVDPAGPKVRVQQGMVKVVEEQEDIGLMKQELVHAQQEAERKAKEMEDRLIEEREKIEELMREREQMLKGESSQIAQLMNEREALMKEKEALRQKMAENQARKEKLKKTKGLGALLKKAKKSQETAGENNTVSDQKQEAAKLKEWSAELEKKQAELERKQTEIEKTAATTSSDSAAGEGVKAAVELDKKIEEHKNRAELIKEQVKQDNKVQQNSAEVLRKLIDKERESAAHEKEDLTKQLKLLQEKLLNGGENFDRFKVEATKAKQKLEEARRREMEEKKEKIALAEKQAKLQEEKVLLEEKYANGQEEIAGRRKKLKKLRAMYKHKKEELKATKQEVKDLQDEFENEKEGYLSNIREIYRELALKKEILKAVLPATLLKRIEKEAKWDPEEEKWHIPDIEMPTVFPKIKSKKDPRSKPERKHWSADLRRRSEIRMSGHFKRETYYPGETSFDAEPTYQRMPTRLHRLGYSHGRDSAIPRKSQTDSKFRDARSTPARKRQREMNFLPKSNESNLKVQDSNPFKANSKPKSRSRSVASFPVRSNRDFPSLRNHKFSPSPIPTPSSSKSAVDVLLSTTLSKPKFEAAVPLEPSTKQREVVDLKALLSTKRKPKFEPAVNKVMGSRDNEQPSYADFRVQKARFEPAKQDDSRYDSLGLQSEDDFLRKFNVKHRFKGTAVR
ncbi:hypothetical protein AAMO2058_000016200 [Amorphochlora amoebiformis]